MTPLRRFGFFFAPLLLVGACAELIGLSDYEKGEVEENGEGGEGTGGKVPSGGVGASAGSVIQKGGRGSGGTGKGGVGPGGEGGEGGVAGDTGGSGSGRGGSDGGIGGSGNGGSGAAAGVGGSSAGTAGAGGAAGSGAGGSGATGGGGTGSCSTVSVTLRNANFDSGTTNWTHYDDPSVVPIIVSGTSVGVAAETPPNVAHFGGQDDLYAEIFQAIQVPDGATTLTLSGFRLITTDEDPDGAFDTLNVQLYEDAFDSGTLIDEFVHWSNLNNTNGWVTFSYSVDISGYAGRIIDFDLWSSTDTSIRTEFNVDSLALTARVCQ